jgi:peptide/nickel transport system ATP-binding protein
MPEPLVAVDDLVVEYPSKGVRRHAFRALKGVSVDIRPGETVGLVGESGSGKTTLGRAILGLAPVTSGSITFKGREIGSLPRRERRALSSEIQVVFQDPYSSLNPSLTIEQTLTEPLMVRKMPKKDATARVRNLLDQVKLPRDALDRLPREFSGGQRQRIAIARAVIRNTPILILDEPSSGLDAGSEHLVFEALDRLMEGKTCIIVAHRLSTIRRADVIFVVKDGAIVERGKHDELMKSGGLYSELYALQFQIEEPEPAPAK